MIGSIVVQDKRDQVDLVTQDYDITLRMQIAPCLSIFCVSFWGYSRIMVYGNVSLERVIFHTKSLNVGPTFYKKKKKKKPFP